MKMCRFSCKEQSKAILFVYAQWNHPKYSLISSSTSSQALCIPVLSSWTSSSEYIFPIENSLPPFSSVVGLFSYFTIFIFIPKTYQFFNNKLNGTYNVQQRL